MIQHPACGSQEPHPRTDRILGAVATKWNGMVPTGNPASASRGGRSGSDDVLSGGWCRTWLLPTSSENSLNPFASTVGTTHQLRGFAQTPTGVWEVSNLVTLTIGTCVTQPSGV